MYAYLHICTNKNRTYRYTKVTMTEDRKPEDKLSRWYFGGTASAIATCVTHPLDLIKVHLQTQQEKMSFIGGMARVVQKDGKKYTLNNYVSLKNSYKETNALPLCN